MKKFDFDKKYIQIAILTVIVLATIILFDKIVGNLGAIHANIKGTFSFLTTIIRPFIIGFAIAYFLNPCIRYIENISFVKNSNFFDTKNRKRILSVVIIYIIFVLCIYLVISSVLPNVVSNINILIATLPNSIEEMSTLLMQYSKEDGNVLMPTLEAINQFTKTDYSVDYIVNSAIISVSQALFKIPNIFSSVVIGIISIANGIIAVVLGFVISIYMLFDKEYFKEQFKKITLVLTKKSTAQKIFNVMDMANQTFEKFIVGKAIDSFLIGTMFFFISMIFQIPYASLFGIIIGVTNMIPYFGPFIGAVPILLITLVWDFYMVIPVGIAILILQQFDGIVLGPKILGDSMGLRPISIIFAILIGGELFGVIGMFLGAPVYAVTSTILNEILDKNYEKKMYS